MVYDVLIDYKSQTPFAKLLANFIILVGISRVDCSLIIEYECSRIRVRP